MNFNHKRNPNLFPDYLDSLIKLDELQQMTDHLDDELADSQQLMMNIKTMFDSIPKVQGAEAPANNALEPLDLSRFVAASPPQLLMQDMSAIPGDFDLDSIIAAMKSYAEDLRRNIVLTQDQNTEARRPVESLDLSGYASSLDQLVKRLANLKLHNEEAKRNIELEAKLELLCQDVNMFTQMVEAKKTLTESDTNWSPIQLANNALYYDNVINKLLADINEVTYLLKNKN